MRPDVYKKIALDERVLQNLARLGMSLDDVPPLGQRIELKASGSRHDGAIYIDVTDDIHPVNAALLRTAANVVGLDIAGIDVVAPDIAQPLLGAGGAIIEINDSPGFSLHLFPWCGTSARSRSGDHGDALSARQPRAGAADCGDGP